MPGKPSPREQLAMDLHAAHHYALLDRMVPRAPRNAWDSLDARARTRWLAVADLVLDEDTRKRLNGLAGRRIRDKRAAS